MNKTRDDTLNDWYFTALRGLELEGSLSGERPSGGWPQWTLRVRFGWGDVARQDLPECVSIREWPLQDVPGLDDLAKPNRSGPYYHLRDAADCRDALESPVSLDQLDGGRPVNVAVEITREWIDPPEGIIPASAAASPGTGSHSFPILTVTADGSFGFRNSWGERWGKDGCGLLPFEVLNRRLITATTFLAPLETSPSAGTDVELLQWFDRTHRGEVFLAYVIYDRTNDERLGWAFAVERDGRLECEELFVKPAARRRGYGRRLFEALRNRAFAGGRGLTFWIPYADSEPGERLRLRRFFKRFGYGVAPSGVRWTPYAATKGFASKPIPDVPFPEKPGRSLVALKTELEPEPNWSAAGLDPEVLAAAKDVFRRRRELLKRLA